jgi:hypothetical protein
MKYAKHVNKYLLLSIIIIIFRWLGVRNFFHSWIRKQVGDVGNFGVFGKDNPIFTEPFY